MFKFQLPIFRGTDLFPNVMHAPTAVRTNIIVPNRLTESQQQEVATEAMRIIDLNRPAIMRAYTGLRQRYDLSGQDYMKATRPFPGGDMSLSINFGQEILTLNVYPQVTARVEDLISRQVDFLVFNLPVATLSSSFFYDFLQYRIDILVDGEVLDIAYEYPPPGSGQKGVEGRGFYGGVVVAFASQFFLGYTVKTSPLSGALEEIYVGPSVLVDLRALASVTGFAEVAANFYGSWMRVANPAEATPEQIGAYAWMFAGSLPNLNRDWEVASPSDVFVELAQTGQGYAVTQKRTPVLPGATLPVYPYIFPIDTSQQVNFYRQSFNAGTKSLGAGERP